jgi:hypothetical protein
MDVCAGKGQKCKRLDNLIKERSTIFLRKPKINKIKVP